MKSKYLRIMLILLFLLTCFGIVKAYIFKSTASREAMYMSVTDISSTKDWQDALFIYINKRNELINDILGGKYDGNKKWVSQLKSLECPPLLYGDISLIEYMSKNPGQFASKIKNIKVEYNNIRQLTKDEVAMNAKISYVEDSHERTYDYEVTFKLIDDKWLLSKFTYAE